MKILFLTPRLPYPLDAGTSLRNFRLIQSAAGEHEVHLLSFADGAPRPDHLDVLRAICGRVEVQAPPPHSRVERLRRLVGSRLPDMAYRRWLPGFARALRRLLAEEHYDVVQAEGIEMARYLAFCPSARRIFSEHNVEHLLQQRAYVVDRSHPRRWPQAAYSLIQARRLARFEAAACRLADAVLTVSDEDACALKDLEPRGRYRVVPNAIAAGAYPARASWPERPSLLFTGTLDYRPNADAVRWLLDLIMPLVWQQAPQTRIFVVGRGPAPDLVARGQHDPRIAVTGTVESLDPYWARATVYVLPMRGGGGTRFKALEAMAAGLPIVSTSMGMEGIAAEDGTHFLAGETPPEIAAAVGRLLDNAPLRDAFVEAAVRLVRERYDWRTVAPRLLAVYREVQ